MKLLNGNKTRFPWFDKFIVIKPVAKVYGESNERQLCWEYVFTNSKMQNHGLASRVTSRDSELWGIFRSKSSLLFVKFDNE